MRVQRVGDRTKQTRVAPHKMRDHPPDGMAWRLRYQECRISAAKEHGKNNFGETKVAITLRGMISRRYSEVVFPVFLSPEFPSCTRSRRDRFERVEVEVIGSWSRIGLSVAV